MYKIDFSGKDVLVTGGSSGIGNGIARIFREAGARVTITGTRAQAQDYDSDLGEMRYFQLDVGDDAAIAAFDPGFKKLDTLVNSVGTVAYKRREFETDTWRRVIDVNLTGVMQCCTKFHVALAAAKGSIVMVSSMASFHAVRGNPAYSASKGALRTLVMSLAEAWARDGIRVNAVAPGYVETKLTRISRDNQAIYEKTIADTPLGRWGEPEEMGTAALFLASPMASFITGHTLPVDGGKGLS
ncbi:MAG TPA: SDR family oxidoreductase [Stellaceae bacterium]|nr:SDR family oxidoreductase [Stellaceae bacterium]